MSTTNSTQTQNERVSFSPSKSLTVKPSIARKRKSPTTKPIQTLFTTKRPSTIGHYVSPKPTVIPPTIQHGNQLAGSLYLVIFLAGVLGIVIVVQLIYLLCKKVRLTSSRVSMDNISTHPGTVLISSTGDQSLELTETVDNRESHTLV